MTDDTADFLSEMGYGRTCGGWDGKLSDNPVWCKELAVCRLFGINNQVILLCERHKQVAVEVLDGSSHEHDILRAL